MKVKVQHKKAGVVLALLILLLDVLPLDAQRQDSQSADLRNALEIFAEKPVHDQRDPIIGALLKRQRRFVPQLQELLLDKQSNPSIRAWIAFLTVLLQKDVAKRLVPELILALDDPCWQVRMNAANSLGNLQEQTAVSQLAALLNDPEIFVRDSAEDALAKLVTPESLRLLANKLASAKDSDARRRLTALIGSLPTAGSVPLLKSLLTAADAETRRIAIYYLGQHPQGGKELTRFWAAATNADKCWILEAITTNTRESLSLDFLNAALAEPAPQVRTMAIWLLNDIGTPAAYRCLEKFWQKQHMRANQPINSDIVAALMVLGQHGDRSILLPAQKIIQNPQVPEYLRAWAIYALGGLGSWWQTGERSWVPAPDSGYLGHIAANVRTWRYQLSNQALPGSKLSQITTANYRIFSDIGKSFCQRIALMMEYLHWYYHRQLAPTAPKKQSASDAAATVYIFGNRRQFNDYARPQQTDWPFLRDSGAYYVPERQEIITYTRHDRRFIFRTLFHETWHQVFNRYVSISPLWLNEGLAEYYSHISGQDGDYRSGQLSQRYLKLIKKNLVAGEYTPLEYLLQLDHRSFHNDRFGPEELGHYAQSWSLVYFFYHADKGAYRPILQQYIASLQRGGHPVLALQEVLRQRQLSLNILQKRWEAYFLLMPEK